MLGELGPYYADSQHAVQLGLSKQLLSATLFKFFLGPEEFIKVSLLGEESVT